MGPSMVPNRARSRKRSLQAIAPLAVVLVAASACSSSGSSPSATPGSGSSSGATTGTTSDSCVTQATALVAQHLASKSQNWYPTDSPKGAVAKGKSFWVIPVTTAIPTLADYAKGFQNAAAALGAKATIFDGQGTPAGAAQGINSAIAAHADGIVTALIDPKSIVSAVDNAKAANIPIIEADSGPPVPPYVSGVEAAAAQNQTVQGSWQVDYALKMTSCKLHVLLVNTPGNIASDSTNGGSRAELAKLCPTACNSYDAGVAVQDLATKTTGLVENAVRLHPDINAIIEVADVYQPYVATALAAVGKSVPVITTSSMGNLANVGKVGAGVAADVVYAPGLAHGWFYMTAVLKLLNGGKAVAELYPIGLVDASNRAANDPSNYVTPPYANFEAQFKQLWGV
jgi:ABC-type sugar transport system substrate-binding protein